jgi:transposase
MPFQETCALDETVRFVAACLAGEETMTALCRAFGISRQWGYELVRRYDAKGAAGLEPRSRAPHHPSRAMAAEIAAAIIGLRGEYPSWGPKKLRRVLQRRLPQTRWPAASSIGDLLRREGLVGGRRRRRLPLPVSQPFAAVTAPNDLWCIDFKGWFRTGDGERCDPLTLSDADSRYLLACRVVVPTTAGVAAVTDAAPSRLQRGAAARSLGSGDPGQPLSAEWPRLPGAAGGAAL